MDEITILSIIVGTFALFFVIYAITTLIKGLELMIHNRYIFESKLCEKCRKEYYQLKIANNKI